MADREEGAFGQFVDKDIIEQIQLREHIQGKDRKKDVELGYLHSNEPWIVLRSSVDTPVSYGEKPLRGTATSNSVAKEYVLCGGTMNVTENQGFNRHPGYELSESMGYRPKPGITGLKVSTKDTWGMVMEAEISITAWTLEDLTALDKIYFKPGMSALLEWGHTNWVNGSKEDPRFRYMNSSDLYLNSTFFDTNVDFETIDREVQSQRKKYCGNYEVMFGYITNFSYAFNKNGSYSCTVKMLSKGAVLKGLQIPAHTGRGKVTDEDSKIKSAFHEIFYWMEKGFESQSVNQGYMSFSVHGHNYPFFGTHVQLKKTWFLGSGKRIPLIYINLRTLEHIVNDVLEEKYGESVPFQFDVQTTGTEDSEKCDYKYVSFPEHFSLNPLAAFIPIQPGEPFTTCFIQTFEDRDASYIGDICVSTTLLLGILDSIIDEQAQSYNVETFLRNVLAEVQKALGNINSFDIWINNVNNKAYIIDRNYITGDNAQIPPEITVSGKNTTVLELSAHSEVSADIANEMSIAATAPRVPGESDAETSMVFWNEGCVDRHRRPDSTVENRQSHTPMLNVPAYSASEIPDPYSLWETGPEQVLIEELGIKYSRKAFDDFSSKAESIYKNLMGAELEAGDGEDGSIEGVRNLIEDQYRDLQLDGEAIFHRIIDKLSAADQTEAQGSNLQMGIIPVKVEFTMKGISRFIVGTIFKISAGILPKKYNDWNYIVTGVEHTVNKGGWVTKIKSQYYPALKYGGKSTSTAKQSSVSTEEEHNSVISSPFTNWTVIHLRPSKATNVGLGKKWSNYGDLIADLAKAKHFPIDGGQCGAYTWALASLLMAGEISNVGGHNANSLKLEGDLKALGYQEVSKRIYVKGWREARKLALNPKDPYKLGDIIIYYNYDNLTPARKGKRQHVQMYVGTVRQGTGKWCADKIYNSTFVYSDDK